MVSGNLRGGWFDRGAVIPPWQTLGETGHFEYAWRIAHLARNARRLVEEEYAWERSVEMVEGVYRLAIECEL